MNTYRLTDWLPTTKKEMEIRGWEYLDVILFSGDAYVDHPSFGAAVIGRILEAEGLRVGIVPQPDWRGDYRDFKKLGIPRLFFGVSPGAMDSMVNHYTAVVDSVGYLTVFYLAVRGLDETEGVDAREGSERTDQTNVWTFRGLNWTHSAVV